MKMNHGLIPSPPMTAIAPIPVAMLTAAIESTRSGV